MTGERGEARSDEAPMMSGRDFKVLLIYPGLFMQTALPLGLAALAGSLRAKRCQVRVFDTVLYAEPGEHDENEERTQKHHSTRQVDYAGAGVVPKRESFYDDLSALLRSYQPDLIGLSVVESTFVKAANIARHVKRICETPIIMGGVFPTLAPDVVMGEPAVDMVCVGEGEETIVELCDALGERKTLKAVPGVWFKENGAIVRNGSSPLRPLEELPPHDFSVFAPWMFLKPMQGNLFKTIPIEMSRGCPYDCAYCAEPALRDIHRQRAGGYFRKKPIPLVLRDIAGVVAEHQPQFIYFTSETFLAMTDDEFAEFVEGYRTIGIPFWIQTRPETVTEKKVRALQSVGMYWLTVGIECGNEAYRRTYLHRKATNAAIVRMVEILEICGQGASLNSIIGLPFEDRDLILETIGLNQRLYRINRGVRINISMFAPFRGCELHELCVRHNLMADVPYLAQTNVSGVSPLSFEKLTAGQLAGLYRTFTLYVYLPDEDLDDIQRAEALTPEGDAIYARLNDKVNDVLSAAEAASERDTMI